MLNLSDTLLDAIYAHGEETFPGECCGVILGTKSGDQRTAVALHPAKNLAAGKRNDRYEMDPEDRKAADEKAAAEGLEVVGIYHSHPDHDCYFSETDLQCCEEYIWGEPWIPSTYSYPVVSIKAGKRTDVKSFIVVEGQAEEEELNIS